ncbi:MAG: DUF5652 family protein [Nanoarchaeota archaeon]
MYTDLMYGFYQHPVNFLLLIVLLSIWELVWKGFGLWHSAQNKQKGWYIAMLLLINTAGLLPIIYLIWFKPKQKKEMPLKSATKSVRRKK